MPSGTPNQRDFARVYDEHVSAVHGFFGYRVRAREDAEDLTQRTFERALRGWKRYDERKASVRTWLMAIARNLLIDHYRADRSAMQRPLEEDDPALREARVEGPGENLGLSPQLADALSTLSGREREILALRYGADMTGPEIAELSDLSLANVQQINSRALRKLRERFGPQDREPR